MARATLEQVKEALAQVRPDHGGYKLEELVAVTGIPAGRLYASVKEGALVKVRRGYFSPPVVGEDGEESTPEKQAINGYGVTLKLHIEFRADIVPEGVRAQDFVEGLLTHLDLPEVRAGSVAEVTRYAGMLVPRRGL